MNIEENKRDASEEVLSKVTGAEPFSIPFGDSRIVIGYYPGINGEDSKGVLGVEPTRDEIKALVRYHSKLLRAVDENWSNGQSGSWEIRQFPYSNSRINYYAQFLSEKEVDEIVKDVYKDFNERDADVPF